MIHGIQSAAQYCECSVSTLRKHIYQLKTLKADANIVKTLIFTQATLDAWQASRRKGCRPRKDKAQ